jgi:hypothetical protein
MDTEHFEDLIFAYLNKYDLELQFNQEFKKDMITGSLFIYKLDTNKSIGHLHYIIDREINDLYIQSIDSRGKDKLEISIKLTKIFLLYLLSKYQNKFKTASLTANPGSFKVGTEFCLLCFYQRLGFEPVNYEAKEMIESCLEQLEKINPNCYNKPSMCILCECQKYKIKFTDKNISHLQVDMKALKIKMLEVLEEASIVMQNEMS